MVQHFNEKCSKCGDMVYANDQYSQMMEMMKHQSACGKKMKHDPKVEVKFTENLTPEEEHYLKGAIERSMRYTRRPSRYANRGREGLE